MQTPIPQHVNSSYHNPRLTNPVGQLVEVGERGEILYGFCTGFNIQGGLFLTAGHCFLPNSRMSCEIDTDNLDLRKYRISYDYQCQSNGDYRVCSLPILENTYKIHRLEAQGHCAYNGNKRLDYSVLTLDPAASRYGQLNLTYRLPDLVEPIAIVHHPEGHHKHISQGIVQATDPKRKLFDYTAHTYPGSSGAPVISLKDHKVIGIHVTGSELPNTGNVRIPDHVHHEAVPVKDIIDEAIQHNESWVSKLGLFGRSNTSFMNLNDTIRIGNDIALNQLSSKPKCC